MTETAPQAKNPRRPISYIAVAFAVLIVALIASQWMSRPKWEYRVVAPGDALLIEELNELGASGWEVVSSRRATSQAGGSASYELILKRERSLLYLPEQFVEAVTDGVTALGVDTPQSTANSSYQFLPTYPKPDDPSARLTLRACIDGKVHAPEGEKWVIFRMEGSTLPCRPE